MLLALYGTNTYFVKVLSLARPLLLPSGADVTVTLPDGNRPGRWEERPRHSHTYFVDQTAPEATDAGDGSSDRPFRTISRAAEAVKPGERVLVAPGIYREHVRPAHGGNGPDEMVTFEAMAGRTAIIRGSTLLPAAWERSTKWAGTWTLRLPDSEFGRHNPFALQNLDKSDPQNWQTSVPVQVSATDTLARGLVFQDGRRLRQVPHAEELLRESGGYCVDDDGWSIHLRPVDDADPNQVTIEATNRAQGFAPVDGDVSYLRLDGFVIEHIGNGFSYPVEGAISPSGGCNWIIENNVIRHINADGINVGRADWQWGGTRGQAPRGGSMIVRRNVIADCGVSGMKGHTLVDALIEDNVIEDIGWQGVEWEFDNGGLKLLVCTDTLVHHNLIRRTTGAPGVWLDWDNINCRVTQNTIVDIRHSGGGVFVEASEQTNWVDHNTIWNVQGNGIYLQDCDAVDIFGNVIGHSTAAAVDGRVCTDRQLNGRPVTCKRNNVYNNTLVDNAVSVSFSDTANDVRDNIVIP
jgi:alpha-N-arabinofuranosidase